MTPPEADCAPMPDQTELGELVAYLVRSSRLSPAEASRVVNEVIAFFDETVDDFIRRRHLALQAQGQSNSEIFAQIASELGAAPLSRARLHRAADPASHLWLTARRADPHVRNRRLHRQARRGARSSWKGCIGSSIAATTRRASPARATASSASTRAKGKVRELERQLPAQLKGTPGIAHTRWATHGEPSDRNAHPHCDGAGRFAIVHNGIIENAAQLRTKLQAGGVSFQSETDSEVLAHLIAAMPADKLEDSVRAALRLVTGTYGLAVLDAQRPESIVVARNGSPVVLGIGDREMFVASDPAALVRHTQSVVHLDDGEIAVVRADGFETSTLDGGATAKTPSTIAWTDESFDKSGYTHYMRKEIAEQPEAIRRTLSGRLDARFQTTHLGGVEMAARELLEIRRVKILGCGSAYIAGCVGAHLIEQLARIPAHAEPASEFRYRNPVDRAGHALHRREPVRRNLRHARGGPGSEAQRRTRARHRQRRRQHRRARVRPRHLSARRSGDRGGRDQDVHVARSSRSRCSRFISAAFATCRPRRAHGCSRRWKHCPRRSTSILAQEAHIAALAQRAREVRRRLFRRPRGGLSGRDGRGSEAKGNQLFAR